MNRTKCGLTIRADGQAYFEDGLLEGERRPHTAETCLSCVEIASGRGLVHAGNLAGYALDEDDLDEQRSAAFMQAARRVRRAVVEYEQLCSRSQQARLSAVEYRCYPPFALIAQGDVR